MTTVRKAPFMAMTQAVQNVGWYFDTDQLDEFNLWLADYNAFNTAASRDASLSNPRGIIVRAGHHVNWLGNLSTFDGAFGGTPVVGEGTGIWISFSFALSSNAGGPSRLSFLEFACIHNNTELKAIMDDEASVGQSNADYLPYADVAARTKWNTEEKDGDAGPMKTKVKVSGSDANFDVDFACDVTYPKGFQFYADRSTTSGIREYNTWYGNPGVIYSTRYDGLLTNVEHVKGNLKVTTDLVLNSRGPANSGNGIDLSISDMLNVGSGGKARDYDFSEYNTRHTKWQVPGDF